MNVQKYLRWKDSLDHYNRLLDDVVREHKPINTNYQKYIKANPYKKRKDELKKLREEYTAKIIHLSKLNYEEWNGKA